MSLAHTTSTTHTDAGLLSRIFNFTSWRSADAEKEPLVPRSGYANIEIQNIALHAYNSFYNHNYVRIEQLASRSRSEGKKPRFRTQNEAAILDKIAIDSASANIRLILRSIAVSKTDDQNIINKLIDRASWALMLDASIEKRGTSPFAKDDSAAYVMEHLLFPLKNEMLFEHDHSLLHMALFQDNYVMGKKVFDAVVSRNDQLLRAWELIEGERALKNRYDIEDIKKYVAKMPYYGRPQPKKRRLI